MMKKFDSINVIPFIDIMLVLLAIVLTTSTFVAKGIIPLNLPKSKFAKGKIKKNLTISIKSDGKIYLGKQIISKKQLDLRLLSTPKKTPIYLRCDKDTRFQFFISTIDILKNRGFNNILMATKR